MNKLRYSRVFSAGDFRPFAFHPFRWWIYDAQRKLLVYVSKCTYFRPKMTNFESMSIFQLVGRDARNYETRRLEIPSISVITSKNSFIAVYNVLKREEKKRTPSGFHHFFHSFFHFQSFSHPFTLILVAFRNARSVKLLGESR